MYHYKDQSPDHTIERIRSILSSLDIDIDQRCSSVLNGNIHSVNLKIRNTDISVNGKGISIELAYASAYAEFMERMQNMFLYPSFPNTPYSVFLRDNSDFIVFPDEKHIAILDVWNSLSDTTRNIMFHAELEHCPNNFEESNILKMQPYKDKLACVPYYRMKTDEVVYMPLSHIHLLYGTNGMSAGNSKEESLVQGISEIMERYVNYRIIDEDICPPTISNHHIKSLFPKTYETIKHIEASGEFHIIVKDCSLDMKLPVVAAILVDKKNSRYFIKFGAHPNIQIALERVLTEMFQGRQLNDFKGFREFEYSQTPEHIRSYQNKLDIFTNGSGIYPSGIFNSVHSDYQPDIRQYERGFSTNKDCLVDLLNVARIHSWDIYLRDCNFLGFPSSHIVIPSVSEVHNIKKSTYYRIGVFSNMAEMLRDFGSLSANDLKRIADYLVKSDATSSIRTSLADITIPYTTTKFNWNHIQCVLLLALIYYKLGMYTDSYAQFTSYLTKIQSNDASIFTYYKCARDYVGAKMYQHSYERSHGTLCTIYGENLVNEIESDFDETSDVFQNIRGIPCPSCTECSQSKGCHYETISNLHFKLKKRMKLYYPSQLLNRNMT